VQHESGTRSDRQATPGPQGKQENGSGTSAQISESPASTDAEKEKPAS
jgi:protein phosphatase 2C family protein 2/3